MRRMLPVLIVLLAAAALAPAGEHGSRTLSGWFNVTAEQGWPGRRYMDGDNIFAEEFDANADGRMDVWRFYRRGLLSSEERDLDGDGRVDFQSRWDAKNVRLTEVLRDTSRHGVNDLEIASTGLRRWEVREDRNQDGTADRILLVNGPPDLFDQLGFDLTSQSNVIDSIPREYWHELWTDDGYYGYITQYYRFTRGELSHRGEWDGRRVAWVKCPPDYMPSAPPPAARPGQMAVVPSAPVPVPGEPVEDIRDPFDFSRGGVDPYEGAGQAPPAGPDSMTQPPADYYPPADPYADQYTDQYAQPAPEPYPQGGGVLRDRTRYEGLPPGDSAARSVPARMRPPGTSKR